VARLQGLAIALDPSSVPTSGGGWPLMDGWARATLSPTGPRLWQTLTHQSACLSCAWGTGGQNGGFRDELGESLQRCLKSVEAIQAELQPAVPQQVFGGRTLAQLQQLSSAECDRLGGSIGRSSNEAAYLLQLLLRRSAATPTCRASARWG
jgi:hypothetical protein